MAHGQAGRFAPSPTGPLHLGSLYTALASFLDARARNHDWLVRIDDLDEPRTEPGAEACILRALESHGLHWDRPVQRQSARLDAYRSALSELYRRGSLYYCTCSRRELRHTPIYPGTCRGRTAPVPDAAVRVRVENAAPKFADLLQGRQVAPLQLVVGDFIVRRRDGIVAYQLATAMDDSEPDIATVVRGRDLLDNTPRQIHLMTLLGRSPPAYAHLPLIVGRDGRKLSKHTGAGPVDSSVPLANIRNCLVFLGLADAPDASLEDLLNWAVDRWNLERVPRNDQFVEPDPPA